MKTREDIMSRVGIRIMVAGTKSNKPASLNGKTRILTREKGTPRHPKTHANRALRRNPLILHARNLGVIIRTNVAMGQAIATYVVKRGTSPKVVQ